MNIKQEIIKCLSEFGIEINAHEDVDLREYFEDSLTFISIIVELEDRLGVEIPDELLRFDCFASLNAFASELEALTKV